MKIIQLRNTFQLMGILFCLLFYSSITYAQTTAIPDTSFEQKLIALGIDSDGLVNGQLLNSDAVGIQSLDLNTSNISDLTGIAVFTDLLSLIVNNNQITNLDVSSNMNLNYLNVSNNQLISFNVQNNASLSYLNVSNNQLASVNILSNTALTYLDVSNNLLTALNLPNATNLRTLKCQLNSLTTIDVSLFPNLETFLVSSNQLTSLDVSNNSALRYFVCADNQLTTLDVSNHPDLIQFFCTSNQLTTLTIANATALRDLRCQYNQLTSLDVINAPLLEELSCSDNQLTQLTFSNSPLLEELSCSENQLSSLSMLHCTAMRTLDLEANVLTTLDITTQASLQVLNVRNNQLTTLDVSGNPAMWRLDCQDNTITGLDLTNNIALSTVYCYNNQLASLVVPNNINLGYLNCSNNQLTTLNILNSPTLFGIGCVNNQLTQLNMPNSNQVQQIVADNNHLTSLNLMDHPNLTGLSVSNNLLTSIDVSNLTNLENLVAEDNLLTSLDVSNNINLRGLVCSKNNISGTLDVARSPSLQNISCYDNQLLRLQLPSTNINAMYCHTNLHGLRICVPDTTAALAKPTSGANAWIKDASAVYVSENCYRMAVKGRVVIDSLVNCIADSLEEGLINKIVRFERGTDVFYTTTHNMNGDYIAHLDTGTFTASVMTGSPYWQSCPLTQTVMIDTNSLVQQLDWALEPVISCPMLRVDIASPFLRLAGGGSYYIVDYCNDGTVAASNAYVEIDLDPSLSITTTSIPIVNQTGNVYTFNVGSVLVSECGSFRINVALDTSVLFGQTHCTEAHIYPDSICIPNIWVNSRLAVDGTCQNDTVVFTISNYGAAMPQPTTYYVFEDNIMMRQNNFQIGSGGAQQVIQPAAAGKTYRIITKQEAGYPTLLGDSIITAVVEGCKPFPDGSFNTGFVTQFSNGDASPFVAVDCQQNIGSYDPNDKQAQPAGYDLTNHYIYDYTALDYRIRFQNTGTDTAFNIVVLDTISPYLDLSTLEMGASSHTYTWSIQDGNVLNVKFSNIMLPDSNVNEPLSNGFFRYRIEQKANNAIGTVINNSAAIYFDYNPPIITNTTWHTVGEDFVSVILLDQTALLNEGVEVKVYPNPFQQKTTLEVKGKTYQQLELSVFDVAGRLVKTITSSAVNRIELSRDDMTQGVYLYQLSADNQLISTGKVVVQ